MEQPSIFTFLKWLIRYITPYKWLALLLLVLLLAESGFDSSLRFSFKFLVEAVQQPTEQAHLFLILWLLGGGVVVYTILCLVADWFWARFGILVINQIRQELFNHVQSLSIEFFSRRQTGDILNCFVADILLLEEALVITLSAGLLSLTTVLISSLFLVTLSFPLAICSIIGLFISLLAPRLLSGKATQSSYTLRQQEGILASKIQEKLLAQPLIKLFGLEKRISEDFSTQLEQLKNVAVPAKFLRYIVSRLPSLLFVLLQVIIITISIFLITEGWLSVSAFAAFQVLFLGLQSAIGNLSWVFPYLVSETAAMQRIEQVLQEVPSVKDNPDAIDLPRLQEAIRFEQVSFNYAEDRPILKKISLSFRRGKFTAIVGPSGSGKSTLVNLLVRFYDLNQGSILFDGVDIKNVTQASLRSQIAVVSQEAILFNCSLRDNIRLGKLEADDEAIETAAKAAEIHEFIQSLPQGYDTVTGERGLSLSGGQKQRIALARALIRNPEILILDEATSALDPITEATILETVERIAQERTVITITHRISQALRADLIYVLKDGRLQESGRHNDLIQQGGLYATLWQQNPAPMESSVYSLSTN